MKGFNRRVLLVMVVTLVLIEMCTLFLMYKTLSNHKPELEKVSLKTEIKKDMFAILIEQEDGTYEESEDNIWPTSNTLMFDIEKSGCINTKGEKLDGAISFENGVATVETGSTAYCYIYFSIDKIAPESFTFYLGSKQNPDYTNQIYPVNYLSWTENDVESYCILNTPDSSACTWTEVSGNIAYPVHQLVSGDGEKTAYAYLKDRAGNISIAVSDNITLDTTAPVINSITKGNKETDSIKVVVDATDELSGIQEYQYKRTDQPNEPFMKSEYSYYVFNGLLVGTEYQFSVYVVDNAGNIAGQIVSLKTEEDSFGGYLVNNPTAGLNPLIEGGMYRYQGTINNVANYVCFGTTDKNTCTSNPGKYMYMIIGVVGEADAGMGTEVNMVKLIKKEALDSTYKWSDNGYDYQWNPNASYVSPLLNGINNSYFLTKTGTYSYFNDSSWLNKIADINWYYVNDFDESVNYTAEEIYNEEHSQSVFMTPKKMSLMYMSDYYYAYQSGGLDCYNNHGNDSTCRQAWIYLNNRDQSPPSAAEWTMQRNGYGSYVFACVIRNTSTGGINCSYYASNYYSASPVFYLTTDVKYSSGTGTSTDPFIIN